MEKRKDTRADTGTEYTEWIEQENFSGKVLPFISDKDGAAKVVKTLTDEPQEISMWTNSSKLDSGGAGYSQV